MKHTHTRIIFSIKDEPVLGMIQREFEDFDFEVKWRTDGSRYKELELRINKIVPFDDEDQIIMEGYTVQFEKITYYSQP